MVSIHFLLLDKMEGRFEMTYTIKGKNFNAKGNKDETTAKVTKLLHKNFDAKAGRLTLETLDGETIIDCTLTVDGKSNVDGINAFIAFAFEHMRKKLGTFNVKYNRKKAFAIQTKGTPETDFFGTDDETFFHDGSFGCIAEKTARLAMTGKNESVHKAGETDIVFNRMCVECKTGSGWLIDAFATSKEDALSFYYRKRLPITRAKFFLYSMDGKSDILETGRIFTQRQFLDILERLNLVRTKPKNGKIGIAIQSFKHSITKTDLFKNELSKGLTVDEFMKKYSKS